MLVVPLVAYLIDDITQDRKMSKAHHNRIYLLATALTILGFSTASHAQESSSQQDADHYEIQPGDVLQISVWKEPDLQMQVLVRPDFAFSFPLAGDVSTKGLAAVDLQKELAKRLSRYISNPVVTVLVREIVGNRVYVIGQVNQPGVFVVNPNVDVMQALSMAGGGTAFASTGNIKILRRSGTTQTAIRFDYDDVLKGNKLEQNITLKSGDTVVVP